MFGDYQCPKMKIRTHSTPVPVDINYPCLGTEGCYAYPGRAPNTDQEVRTLIYRQKMEGDYARATEEAKEQLKKDLFSTKFDRHTEHRRFQSEIKKRLNIRLQEYEASIDARREKLRAILAKEEKNFYWETLDKAQRGDETRLETMKQQVVQLVAKREAERQEIVKQKRLQQYMARCVDLRQVLMKKNVIETRNGQLQQMRENEARREADREAEKMWHDIAMKEVEAKKEREEYDAIDRYERNKANIKVWDTQLQANELLKAEQRRMAEEDRLELEKLQEQLRKEEIEGLIEKQRKRREMDRELREQLEIRQKCLQQRQQEEKALEQAFIQLTQMELDREKAKIQDTTSIAKREMAHYRDSLAQLEREKSEEEARLDQLFEEYKRDIQKKQDEAKCKLEAAKKRLHETVLKERAHQLKEKQEINKRELMRKQDEEEMLKLSMETNDRLAKEAARQEELARKQYVQDLSQQIEYCKKVQEKERQDLERQLAIARMEEEKYQKLVKDFTSGDIHAGGKHPFRKVLERYDCDCIPTVKPPY